MALTQRAACRSTATNSSTRRRKSPPSKTKTASGCSETKKASASEKRTNNPCFNLGKTQTLHRNFSVLPPVCRTGPQPGLSPPDALSEVPPPSRTPLSGYRAAAHAAGYHCPGALAADHEASSAVVTPSRQYKSPAGSGPAGEAAGPGVFVP
jgi:hypothetical protein